MLRPSQSTCQPSIVIELFQVLQTEAAHLDRKELELTSQIKDLSEALVSVRSTLSIIRTRASECVKRISPASRLPDETLLAIFEEAVLSQDVQSRTKVESAISRVSLRWRRIALHTPRLWTRLHLLRSAALPLDVEVWGWWDYRDSFTRPHHFEHTLAAVLPSASRWRRITVGASCDALLASLSFILRTVGSFDALQQVTFTAQQPGQMCPATLLMGRSAPNLRSIDVENIVLTARSPCLRHHDYCFIGLTHLTLRLREGDARALKTMTELQGFRALLLRMPSLVSLSLYGELVCVKSTTNLEDDDNITLPRLQTLIFHPNNVRPRYLRNLIAMIMAPDLRHFELVYPDSFIEGQDISDLLLKKGCEEPTPKFPLVERLVLNNAASITASAAFIQAFPGVEQLTISGADVGIFNQPSWGVTGGSWRKMRRLTLRPFQRDRLTLVVDWLDAITSNDDGEVQAPLVEGPISDCPTILHLYEALKRYTQVELLDVDSN
ncbi:uncharacterized protein EDB91DRAFT_1289164 [Suillus paluster]|uniref:uncharacterized protein n=1 Tax=Suillus paluster TaxID=48578 RepID=UPI001B87EB1A|nr:uncharacterized protein EDB91DRAFT_1289164 [Suillus paluster]KAG1738421.1 hypothetical protein EDB91DRAFT_1289164 [Suillus paluster]